MNYRASTGFGKAFVNVGAREHAGKMHDHLIDAVEWAVAEGIARRDKVAIMGISHGGYASLVGLTFDVFCCGVSIVGISNLVTCSQICRHIEYWAGFDEYMFANYADVRTEEGRAWLRARSPLYRVEPIRRPLLMAHGVNDVRCKLQESDQIVAAMRDRGLPVTYVVYPEEGHGFLRPESRTSFNAITEAFFATHLGGRCEALGNDLVGSTLQVREGIDAIDARLSRRKRIPPLRPVSRPDDCREIIAGRGLRDPAHALIKQRGCAVQETMRSAVRSRVSNRLLPPIRVRFLLGKRPRPSWQTFVHGLQVELSATTCRSAHSSANNHSIPRRSRA